MDLHSFKCKIGLKISDFVFLTIFLPNFLSFCIFRGCYGTSKPFKLYFWYCFVCTTTFSAHLWIYTLSNEKLASKLAILSFLPYFYTNFARSAYLDVPMAHLSLTNYIVGNVLFAHPLFLPIYGFTIFQTENWPQNW